MRPTLIASIVAAALAPAALAGEPTVNSLRDTLALGSLPDPCAGRCGPAVTVDRGDSEFAALVARLPSTLPPSTTRTAVPTPGPRR